MLENDEKGSSKKDNKRKLPEDFDERDCEPNGDENDRNASNINWPPKKQKANPKDKNSNNNNDYYDFDSDEELKEIFKEEIFKLENDSWGASDQDLNETADLDPDSKAFFAAATNVGGSNNNNNNNYDSEQFENKSEDIYLNIAVFLIILKNHSQLKKLKLSDKLGSFVENLLGGIEKNIKEGPNTNASKFDVECLKSAQKLCKLVLKDKYNFHNKDFDVGLTEKDLDNIAYIFAEKAWELNLISQGRENKDINHYPFKDFVEILKNEEILKIQGFKETLESYEEANGFVNYSSDTEIVEDSDEEDKFEFNSSRYDSNIDLGQDFPRPELKYTLNGTQIVEDSDDENNTKEGVGSFNDGSQDNKSKNYFLDSKDWYDSSFITNNNNQNSVNLGGEGEENNSPLEN